MTDYDKKKLDDLWIAVKTLLDANRNLQEQVVTLKRELQETRDCMEKLAVLSGLEWSQDAKTWASGAKLKELRAKPRDD